MDGQDGTVRSVLVVEDDATLGALLELVLGPSTHRLVIAHSGTEALRLADEGTFDAVSVDIGLPDMSGVDVITELRERLPSAGILAVTAYVDLDVAVQSMRAGADDFLAKPFDSRSVWQRLVQAAENRQRRLVAERSEMYRQLAYTGPLTGSPNRRYLDEYLIHAVAASARDGTKLSVCYVDIDNFKLLNDFVGHDQGDVVLQAVAQAIAEEIRGRGVYSRFGGDEFVMAFPGLDRIGLSLPSRISCGVVEYAGQASPRALVADAEDRMYLDKSMAPSLLGMPVDETAGMPGGGPSMGHIKALRSLVKAIDRRDAYTRFHSDHATRLALELGREVGLSAEQLSAIAFGGPIHDLGKIVVPDDVLRKPGPLTVEERRTMEEHPVIGAAITSAISDVETVANLVWHHHERFDGEGYPGRLRELQIAFPTRLFTIADAYSAMTTDRPYRRMLTVEEALAQIRSGRGQAVRP